MKNDKTEVCVDSVLHFLKWSNINLTIFFAFAGVEADAQRVSVVVLTRTFVKQDTELWMTHDTHRDPADGKLRPFVHFLPRQEFCNAAQNLHFNVYYWLCEHCPFIKVRLSETDVFDLKLWWWITLVNGCLTKCHYWGHMKNDGKNFMNLKPKSVQTAFVLIKLLPYIQTSSVMKSQLQEPPVLDCLWMFRVNTIGFVQWLFRSSFPCL